MTKLEQLKAAYEEATPGEWVLFRNDMADTCECTYEVRGETSTGCVFHDAPYYNCAPSRNDATFIALAHNLMPTLLGAAELVETLASGEGEYYGLCEQAHRIMEKFK